MKTYPGGSTYMQFQKKSLPVSVHLSESHLLFQCTPLLKYTKVLSNHILITAVLFGMACLNSWVSNYKNYKIALPEYLLNQVIIRALAIFSTLSAGITYPLEGRSKRQIWCTNALISSPKIIFVTCSLRELCPLIFVTQVKNCTCRNRELTTWSVVPVIAELLFGTIFLRISALQNLCATSIEELINGSLYWTPTRQICKPVNRKFYLRWISSLFSIVILIFYRVLNKDFIHSFTRKTFWKEKYSASLRTKRQVPDPRGSRANTSFWRD